MLVDPMIVSRPGENGSPAGACVFCGASHPAEGPYALYIGTYYCRNDASALAKSLDLLTSDRAQAVFESVALELATTHAGRDSAVASQAAMSAELASATEARDAAEARIAELETELAKTKSYADVIADFLKRSSAKQATK